MKKEVIDPWSSNLPEDYKKIADKFGLEKFEEKDFPNSNILSSEGDSSILFSLKKHENMVSDF